MKFAFKEPTSRSNGWVYEEEAEIERVHWGLARVLSLRQYETSLLKLTNGEATDTYVYVESLEETKDQDSEPH